MDELDPKSQSLAKLARGQDRDLDDVRAMLERDLVGVEQLIAGLEQIEGDLVRYPGLDAVAFSRRVRAFVETNGA